MSVEQRFAWMESMLDTTISAYEAHREALEKVYADLYRLHSGSGCVHLTPAEAEKLLRSIADLLEKNALKLPAFDGATDSTSRDNSPPQQQQQRQPSHALEQRSSKPPSSQPPSTRDHPLAPSQHGPARSTDVHSAKDSSSHVSTSNNSWKGTPASGTSTPKPTPVPSQLYAAEEVEEAPSQASSDGADGVVVPVVTTESSIRSHRDAPSRSASQRSAPQTPSPPRPVESEGRNTSHTPSQVEHTSAKPSLRAYESRDASVTKDKLAESGGSSVRAADVSSDRQKGAGAAAAAPPPANIPTAQHRTPSVMTSDAEKENEGDRSGAPSESASASRASQPQPHARQTPPASPPPQSATATTLSASQRSAAQSSASGSRRPRRGDAGVPLTPWPIPDGERGSAHRPPSSAERTTPSLEEQFSNYRRQPQPQPMQSNEDPIFTPAHTKSRSRSGEQDELPMNRDSVSSLGSSRLAGDRYKPRHHHHSSSSIDNSNNNGHSKRSATAGKEEGGAAHPSATPSQASHKVLYGDPDGMVNSVVPAGRQQDSQSAGAGAATPRSATSLLNGGGSSTRNGEGDAGAEEQRAGPRRDESPDPVQTTVTRHPRDAAAPEDDASASAAMPSPPPKQRGRLRPLRTATPRRTTSAGNNSHQIEELVYKRRISPRRNGGEPVLEDDPAVDAFLQGEDAYLQQRRHHELQEIQRAPACMTEAQIKRKRVLQYTSAAPNTAAADGALVVAPDGSSNGAVATMGAAYVKPARPRLTAAEEQLTRERGILAIQLEKMQHEWEITTSKLKETGNEPRYRQLQSRMERVRADMERVDRELATVQGIEARRARGGPAPR